MLSANHFSLYLAAGAIVAGLGLWLAAPLRALLPRRALFAVLT